FEMEAIVAAHAQEGQAPKTVAQVLPSTKFLQNVGLEPATQKRSDTAAVTTRIQELHAEVASEKLGAASLRDQLDVQQDQLEALQLKVGESEEARERQREEIEIMKKQGEETFHPSWFVTPQQGVGQFLTVLATLQIQDVVYLFCYWPMRLRLRLG
ncbi:hypothetical protein BAE44_0014647, partial [Dichanthelium oligosanthes]